MRPPPDISHRLSLVLITVLLIGAFFVLGHDIANTPPGIAFDATWDVADAFRIGRGLPFPAVFDTRPEPAHRFLLGGWLSLTGYHVYTGRLFHVMFGLLSVALTYQAGLTLLKGKASQRLGALLSAGALTTILPFLFLSRTEYRVILLPPVLLLALILLLRASRSQSKRAWFGGGFFSGLGVHTYLAGAVMPFWGIGFVIHQLIVAKRRMPLRNTVYVALGMTIPLALWGLLIARVPNLFFRLGEASSSETTSLAMHLMEGLIDVPRAWLVKGYHLPLYTTYDDPFLNPMLAILMLIGLVLAIWRWRHAEGAMLLGGLVAFSLPAALSRNAIHPARLIGTMPFLVLFIGWGGAWLLSRLSFLSTKRIQNIGTFGITLLLIGSSVLTFTRYHGLFNEPERYEEPNFWQSVPHNYTIAFIDTLHWLKTVDVPTYVPLSAMDTPATMFLLQPEYFPNVTTWARYDLDELPEGQILYPILGYYHTPNSEADARQVLLLPDEDTIVILPADDGKPVIEIPDNGKDIINDRGWTIARVAPVDARPLPELIFADNPPIVGNGIRLLNVPTSPAITRGETRNVVLYWQVTESPQPADWFTFMQLIGLDLNAYASSDQHVLPYLYPTAMWQAGDIIPDSHRLTIPEDLPNGVYRWGTGAYIPPGQDRLPILPPDNRPMPLDNLWLWDGIRLPSATLNQPLPEEAIELDVDFVDSISLAGYTLEASDTEWTIQLHWHATGSPSDDYTLFVHLQNDETMIVQSDSKPLDGRSPTWAWHNGELITTTHQLTVPDDAPPPNQLYVGMYSFPSLVRLMVEESDVLVSDNRVLIWAEH